MRPCNAGGIMRADFNRDISGELPVHLQSQGYCTRTNVSSVPLAIPQVSQV